MTWQEEKAAALTALEAAGVQDAEIDAYLLLEHVSGKSRSAILAQLKENMPEDMAAKYRAAVKRRIKRVPLQHITGHTFFMGLKFETPCGVLIPRPDTETLAEAVLADIGAISPYGGLSDSTYLSKTSNAKRDCNTGLCLLDMCTGSGCLAISLAKWGRFKKTVASDISSAAIAAARRNAAANSAGIEFFQGDMFDAIPATYAGGFDIIVCNPPYIPAGDIAGLMPEVRDHDPATALDGGADGLDFYRIIAKDAPMYLKQGGRIYLEIGAFQQTAVPAILKDAGMSQIRHIRDMTGKIRVVIGVKEKDAGQTK